MSKKTRNNRAKRKTKRDRIERDALAKLPPSIRELDRIYLETGFNDVADTMLDLTPGTLMFWTEKGRPDGVGALIVATFDRSLPQFDQNQIVGTNDWPVVESRLFLMRKEYLRTLVGDETYELSCTAAKDIAGEDRIPMFGYWSEQYAPLIADAESYEVFGGFVKN